MRRLNINGMPLVLELEWLAVPARKKMAQAEREMRKSRQAAASISVAAGESMMLGMSKINPSEPLISAAAWLGYEHRRLPGMLFIRELDANEFWICGIHKGVPVVAGDRIVQTRDVDSAMNELAALIQSQLPPDSAIHAYADIEHNEQLSVLLAQSGCEPASLESLLAGKKAPDYAILGGPAKSSPQKMIAGFVLGLAIVGGACAGGWYFYQQEQARKAQEEAARAAALAAEKAKPKPDQIYAKAVVDYVNSQTQPRAKEFVQEAIALAFSQPVLESGWKFNAMDCKATTLTCELKYIRMPFGGVFPQQVVGGYRVLNTVNDVESVAVTVEMKTKPVNINVPVDLVALQQHYLESKVNGAALAVLREAKDLKLTTMLRPSQKIQKLPPSPTTDLVEGKWELSGQSVGYELLFNLPDTFTAEIVSVVRGNDVLGMRASGSYLMFLPANQNLQKKG